MEQAGHQCVRMDLHTDTPEASATRYAGIIADSIPEDWDDAIVVAHSASGLFLPLVPEIRRVKRIVFLAGVVSRIGKSLAEQVKEDSNMFNPEWIGKDPTKDPQIALQFLFHDCSAERSQWALSRMSLMFARQAILEVTPLLVWPDVAASYVVCAGDRAIQPEWSRRVARERLLVEPIELPGGHCPYVSRPDTLTDVLGALDF
jgi:hypothetical protein